MPTNNMMDLIKMIKSGNPKQMVMNMMQQNMNNNPVLGNLFNLAQQGNTKEIETIARNIAKERGVDFDKEFNSFKQQFGL